MECYVQKTHLDGYQLPKSRLKWEPQFHGNLVILDVEVSKGKCLKVARHMSLMKPGGIILTLWEPRLQWMNDGVFILVGYEYKKRGKDLALDRYCFAQSWRCSLQKTELEYG